MVEIFARVAPGAPAEQRKMFGDPAAQPIARLRAIAPAEEGEIITKETRLG